MAHILKEVRLAFNQVIADAAISVDVAAVPTPVTILSQPPAGLGLDAEDLPAMFVFVTGEDIEPDTYKSYKRDISILVYMLGKRTDDVLDQLDEMQLRLEVALEASNYLGGLVRQLRPVRTAAAQEQGQFIFGTRSIEYLCTASVTSNNPSV